MAAFQIGQLLGGLVIVTLVSRLFLLPYRKRNPGLAKVAVMDVLAGLLCMFVGAIGMADGGSAAIGQAMGTYLPAVIFVLIYDSFRITRRDRDAGLTVTPSVEGELIAEPGRVRPALNAVLGLIVFALVSTGVRYAFELNDRRELENVVEDKLAQLDGTTEGAMRALREHEPEPVGRKPTDRELADILEVTNENLPAQVDEVTWIVEVSATDDSLVYRYEVVDPSAAELMRTLSSEELKFAIAQGVAQAGTDPCRPIQEMNRYFRIQYDYVDDASIPINSFAYGRGECA